MGDSGSQVIGLALGPSTGCHPQGRRNDGRNPHPAAVALAVPMLDTGSSRFSASSDGRPVSQGGRDHTSHRLVYRGPSEKRAVLLLTAIATGPGATSLAYMVLDNGRITAVGVLLSFALPPQSGSFLSDAQQADDAELSALHALAPPRRGRGRRRARDGVAFYAAYVVAVEGTGTINQRHLFIVTLPIPLGRPVPHVRPVRPVPVGVAVCGARDAALVLAAVVVSEGRLRRDRRNAGLRRLPHLRTRHRRAAVRSWGPPAPVSAFICRARRRIAGRSHQRRVLIVGAGRSAEALRELRETPTSASSRSRRRPAPARPPDPRRPGRRA
jgi:hypothetical protein